MVRVHLRMSAEVADADSHQQSCAATMFLIFIITTGFGKTEMRLGEKELNLYLPVDMLVAAMVFEAAQSHLTYQKL